MARVLITQNVAPKNVDIDSLTFTAADATNDHEFVNDGEVVLIIKNTDASPKTVTVKSVPDNTGRSGDLTVVCPATTGISFVPPLAPSLFNQGGGNKVAVDIAAATGLSFAAVKFTSVV